MNCNFGAVHEDTKAWLVREQLLWLVCHQLHFLQGKTATSAQRFVVNEYLFGLHLSVREFGSYWMSIKAVLHNETLLGKPGHVYRNFGAVQEEAKSWLVREQLHWRASLE